MKRDKGIYNLSYFYDPVINEEINIKKNYGTRSGGKFFRHSAAGSSLQQVLRKQIAQSGKLSTKMWVFNWSW